MARRLEVSIVGDSRSLERALGRSGDATDSFGRKIGRGLANAARIGVIGMASLATGGAFLGKKMVGLASDAAEVQSKMEVVFGKALPDLTKNLDAFSKATGASRFQLREQAADMGALLEPLVSSKKAAADMSQQFVQLATDLGSFNNVPVADALLAIRSGLVGEAEPLRRFSVLLNEAAVQAEAYRLGITEVGSALTEQEKVQARASLIMQQTTLAQGDATRTADSMANQMKALSNTVKDTATVLGQALIPVALSIVQTLNNEVIPAVTSMASALVERVKPAIETVATFIRTHWPQIKQMFIDVANYVRETFGPIFIRMRDIVREAIERISVVVKQHMPEIRSIFTNVSEIIRNLAAVVIPLLRFAFVEVLPRAVAILLPVMEGVTKVIAVQTAAIRKVISTLGDLYDWIKRNATAFGAKLRAPFDALASALSFILHLLSEIRRGIQWLIDNIGRIPSMPDITPGFSPGDIIPGSIPGGGGGGGTLAMAGGMGMGGRTPIIVNINNGQFFGVPDERVGRDLWRVIEPHANRGSASISTR